MSAKKLGSISNQPGLDQGETEGPKVIAVHTWGRGLLKGHEKAAFIASGVSRKVHEALGKFPRDVIVEDAGDELA
jgi:hypothetical protein